MRTFLQLNVYGLYSFQCSGHTLAIFNMVAALVCCTEGCVLLLSHLTCVPTQPTLHLYN